MLLPFPHPMKGDGTQVGLPYWSSTSVSFFPLIEKPVGTRLVIRGGPTNKKAQRNTVSILICTLAQGSSTPGPQPKALVCRPELGARARAALSPGPTPTGRRSKENCKRSLPGYWENCKGTALGCACTDLPAAGENCAGTVQLR